jgi:outer membrane protein TolC
MRRVIVIVAVVILIFAGEGGSGEFVSRDVFLSMVMSGNNMLASRERSAEAAYFAVLSSAARRRPSLGVTAEGSYLSGTEQDGSGVNVGVGITQPIDISGKLGIEDARAILSHEAARVEWERSVNDLLAEAEESYWSAVCAGENEALQADILWRRRENRRIAEERYRQDLAPKLDVIRADALVQAAGALVAGASAERRNMLAAMTSLAGGAAAEPTEALSAPSLPEGYADLGEAFERRPDVRAAKLAVRMAAADRDIASREMSPTLAASAGWTIFSDPSDSSSPQMGEATAALRLVIPILDGGASKYKNLTAIASVQSAEAALEHVMDTARYEYITAVNGWNQASATERAKRSEVEMSNEELRITELMYREGMGAQIDLINAQIENQRIRTDYLTAVRDMHIAIVRIQRSVGDYAAKFCGVLP